MRTRHIFVICLLVINYGYIFTQDVNKKGNAKKITLGIIGKSQSNPVFIAAYAGARVAAKEIGVKYGVEVVIEWQTPKNEDSQEQARTVEKLSRSGAAGIAIACSDAKILTPFINKAVDLGTQVVCFDADAPNSKRFAYYGSDNAEFGRTLMKELAHEMGEHGIVAIIGGNRNASNLQRRIQAVTEEIKKYPSMKLLPNGVFYHDEIPEKAAEVLNHAQKANPEIGGWVLVGGWPLFIKNAIKSEPGQVKIVACDALPSELEYVNSGHVQVLLAQGCFLWGYKSVELLLKKILLNQQPKEEFIPDPPTRVTKANLDEWSLNWKKWLLKEAVNR
jgi:ribose transport system substrate-binding protein